MRDTEIDKNWRAGIFSQSIIRKLLLIGLFLGGNIDDVLVDLGGVVHGVNHLSEGLVGYRLVLFVVLLWVIGSGQVQVLARLSIRCLNVHVIIFLLYPGVLASRVGCSIVPRRRLASGGPMHTRLWRSCW